MQKVIKGAVIGGVLGIAAPVALAVANEFVWSRSSGRTVEPRICFADRLWNLQRVQIVHAPGCKNKILDSVPFCLLLGVLGGSAVGALSLAIKRNTTSPSNSSSSLTSATPASPAATTESVKEPSATTPRTSKQERVSATPPPRVQVPSEGLKGFDWRTVGKLGAVAVVVAGVGFGAVYVIKVMGTNQFSQNPESGDEFGTVNTESFGTPSQREQAPPDSLQATFPNPCTSRQFGGEGADCMAENGFDTIGGWYVKFEGKDANGVEYQQAKYSDSRIYGYYADCANRVGYNRTHSGMIGGGVPMTDTKVSLQICRKYFY